MEAHGEAWQMVTQTDFNQIPDLFIASNSHRNFVLGKRKRYGSSVIMLGGAVLLMLLGVFVTAIALEKSALFHRLESDGVETGAIITQLRTSTSRNVTSYTVVYQFKADERTLSHQQGVYESTYNQLSEGDIVQVRYLPNDPRQAMLIGDYLDSRELDSTRDMWLWFGPASFIGMGACLWIDQRNVRYSRRGVLLPGKVMRAELKRGYRNAPYFRIEYAFTTPSGTRLEGEMDTNDMRVASTQPPPAFGTPVAVLYVDDKHYRMM
jgi:hypothetical protein